MHEQTNSFIPTWADQVANEVWAHYHHRYEMTLKNHAAHLSFNEIVGILARRIICRDAWESTRNSADRYLHTYGSTTMGSSAFEFVVGREMVGPDKGNWMEKAAEEIGAHLRERYECALKQGQSHVTTNEAIGIIAKNSPSSLVENK